MAYIVAAPCIDVKDKACIDVCPVDCIYEGANQLFIHPEECIDCQACEPVCPVDAIYLQSELPEKWASFVDLNAQFFKANSGASPAKR